MTFARISMLFLVWLAPLLLGVVFWGMRRRKRILEQYATSRCLAAIVDGPGATGRRWAKAGLLLLVILLLIICLAGPRYGYRWQEVERRGIDIILALDCSRSMLAADIKPTRLDRAKREIIDLLSRMQGDRVGLTAFAGAAFLQCPLTLDYEAFHIFLNTLTPDSVPVGGTDLAGALQTSLDAFDPEVNAEKAVILITDGESTGGNPIAAAGKAAKAGVKVFCIGVGGAEGVPVPDKNGGFKKGANGQIVLTRLDEDTLKQMAVMTGGIYVRSVAGDMDLDIIYDREIRGKMDAATLTRNRKKVWEDRFQWFLGAAILLLLIEMMLPAVRGNRLMPRLFPVLLLPVLWLTIAGPASAASVADTVREGREAYARGDYEKALKHFIDAQLAEPDNPELYYNIGNTYYKMGNYEAAREQYGNALAAGDAALKSKTHFNLGNTAFRRKDYKEAVKQYETALKLTPEDRQARENLAFAHKVMQEQPKQSSQSSEGDNQEKSDQNKSGDQKETQGASGREKQEQGGKQSEQQKSSEQSGNQGNQQADRQPDAHRGGQKKSDGKAQQRQAASQDGKTQEKQAGREMPQPIPDQDAAGQGGTAQQQTGAALKPGEAEKQQARRILNRLQDQPGGAMVPQYGERTIEKDW